MWDFVAAIKLWFGQTFGRAEPETRDPYAEGRQAWLERRAIRKPEDKS